MFLQINFQLKPNSILITSVGFPRDFGTGFGTMVVSATLDCGDLSALGPLGSGLPGGEGLEGGAGGTSRFGPSEDNMASAGLFEPESVTVGDHFPKNPKNVDTRKTLVYPLFYTLFYAENSHMLRS